MKSDPTVIEDLKREPPRSPSNAVQRSRLTVPLPALARCRLVLVTAPAGFGKTILLTQWCEHLERNGTLLAWLSLDGSDRDGRRLLLGIVRSLTSTGLELVDLPRETDRDLSEIRDADILQGIVNGLQQCDRSVVLMLDDYHRASSPAADLIIERLVQRLPANASLFLASRLRPGFPVDRLFASGEAAEISGDMLRFTKAEAREFLGADLLAENLDALYERVEGWPVALQLMRVLAFQGHSLTDALSRLASYNGHLWTLLSDQVLNGLRQDCVDFLLETSILERFSVEIADAVRGRNDSWQMLEPLTALQSLIGTADGDGKWFRYHHLLADYLQDVLAKRHPGQVDRLHLRASKAFERQGLLEEAVRHASMAADYGRCADLIEAAGGWRLVLFGGLTQLEQLLNFVPSAERLSHPRLLLAEAYLHQKRGRLIEARTTYDLVVRERTVPDGRDVAADELDRDALNVGLMIRLYEDNRIDGDYLASVRELASREKRDRLTEGIVHCCGALASLRLGALVGAEKFARDAMGAMRAINSLPGLNYCFLHAGLSAAYRGDMKAAEAYLRRAQEMAAENFGADSGLKAMSTMLLAALELWRGEDISSTSEDLDEAFRHVCEYDGWFEIYCAGLDTRFRLAWLAGDLGRMDTVLADGAKVARDRGLHRLSHIVEAQRILRFIKERPLAIAGDILALENLFPIGCWRDNPASWRAYQDVGFALAMWHKSLNAERALTIAQDLHDCAVSLGARVYVVRALALRASIHVALRQISAALADLRQAAETAAPDEILLPFVEQGGLRDALAEVEHAMWQAGGNVLGASFLSRVRTHIGKLRQQDGGVIGMLSPREQEVLRELAKGLTNKEIARMLDMTEHTVKFHLKHIFTKLGVERRAHAITLFTSLNTQD